MKAGGVAVLAALCMPLAVCAQPQPQPALETAAATITEADYLRRVGVIAHDSMQGRDTPSPGLDKTATWIASEFRRMGLSGGAGDGGFIQRYPLRSVVVDRARSNITGGGRTLEYGRDVVPLAAATGEGESRGGLVLISGSTNPGAALSGNAVRGRHAVFVLPSSSRGVDQDIYRMLLSIRNAGAASVLVTSPASDAVWAADAARALRPSVAQPGTPQAPAAGAFRPILEIRDASLGDLVRGRGVDVASLRNRGGREMRVDAVDGVTLTLTQRVSETDITAPNVVGLLPGSDPVLRNEYVIFSGHMDHVGIGTPDANGDSIFNGADDDASGTVAVVEIAEAMASLPTPPRRSTLFLLVSGEEKGLWGSEYYADHPTVPIQNVVADLNTDMVGRNWPDTIVAIGKEHSDLGQTLERVNAAHPELGMTAIDDLWPEESFYTRSDHFNFARKGVPILFFFNGTHEDYHGRDDEVDRINGEKAARIARLVFYLGVEIADAQQRPQWNPDSYAQIATDRPR
ncbi:MAG: M28 family peptidase [Gemmatimonadales bacterium]